MLLTLHNEFLTLDVDTLGAQMMSLRTGDGVEYLWQGDPRYWTSRAPNLFPVIARLYDNCCTVHGKSYTMKNHGFARGMEFTPIQQSETALTLELCSCEETRERYPFDFSLCISYVLRENAVFIGYRVENRSAEVMPFGIGGHPGFRVPLTDGEKFEDYTLEFAQACRPDRVGFTDEVFLSGRDEPYPLREERFLPLRHTLFNNDAVILKNMCTTVTLRSGVTGRSVTVSAPEMPYLGLWHKPCTDAPYVCIEPWTSLPARQGVTEELTCKSDLVHLAPGRVFSTQWSIALTEN